MSAAIRVLLVEDNPGDADLTRDTLEDSRIHLDITTLTQLVVACGNRQSWQAPL